VQAIQNFIDMGGYGAFVWPSYIVSALVLIGMLGFSVRQLRANAAEMARLEKASGERQQQRGEEPGETQA